MCHVFLAHILRINVIVDINSFLDRVAPEPFHVLTPHSSSEKMSGEPVSAAVRPEPVGELARFGIMQSDYFGMLGDQSLDLVLAHAQAYS